MTNVVAFCTVGQHPGPVCGTVEDGGALPPGWTRVRCSLHDGIWVEDPDSKAILWCCPEHLPRPLIEIVRDRAHLADLRLTALMEQMELLDPNRPLPKELVAAIDAMDQIRIRLEAFLDKHNPGWRT